MDFSSAMSLVSSPDNLDSKTKLVLRKDSSPNLNVKHEHNSNQVTLHLEEASNRCLGGKTYVCKFEGVPISERKVTVKDGEHNFEVSYPSNGRPIGTCFEPGEAPAAHVVDDTWTEEAKRAVIEAAKLGKKDHYNWKHKQIEGKKFVIRELGSGYPVYESEFAFQFRFPVSKTGKKRRSSDLASEQEFERRVRGLFVKFLNEKGFAPKNEQKPIPEKEQKLTQENEQGLVPENEQTDTCTAKVNMACSLLAPEPEDDFFDIAELFA